MTGDRWVLVQALVDANGLVAALELAGKLASPAELARTEAAALLAAEAARQREEPGSGEPIGAGRIVLRDLGGRQYVNMADPIAARWQAELAARVAELAARAEAAIEASRQPVRSELDQVRRDRARWNSPADASARLRATLDAAPPPLDAEAADAVREAMVEAGAAEVLAHQDAARAMAPPGWVPVADFVVASGRYAALTEIGVSVELGDLVEAETDTLRRNGVIVRDDGCVRNDDPDVHAWVGKLSESVALSGIRCGARLWKPARSSEPGGPDEW